MDDMIFRNSLSSFPSISREKRTTTILTPEVKYFSLKLFSLSIGKETGVDMFTGFPRNSESAVAEDPIIWFMTSQIALTLISFISNSSSGISAPMSIPTIIRTSLRRNIMILLPSRPSV